MKWNSVNEKLPLSSWKICLFTDGEFMGIGYYVNDPKVHGCFEIVEEWEDDEICGIEIPHWHAVQRSSSFIDGEECFGYLDPTKVTHWMELPPVPSKVRSYIYGLKKIPIPFRRAKQSRTCPL